MDEQIAQNKKNLRYQTIQTPIECFQNKYKKKKPHSIPYPGTEATSPRQLCPPGANPGPSRRRRKSNRACPVRAVECCWSRRCRADRDTWGTADPGRRPNGIPPNRGASGRRKGRSGSGRLCRRRRSPTDTAISGKGR